KGKLLVYEKSLPGRFATDAHAVQAKKAVSRRNSVGSLMNFAGKPALCAGDEKYAVQRSTCFSYDAASPGVNSNVRVRGSNRFWRRTRCASAASASCSACRSSSKGFPNWRIAVVSAKSIESWCKYSAEKSGPRYAPCPQIVPFSIRPYLR